MNKVVFTAVVVGAFLSGYFIGCGDEDLPAAEGALRYVYEVSEANVTGAGGNIPVSVLHVGHAGEGGRDMAQVVIYGSGYGNNDHWRMLTDVEFSEGKVYVNTDEHPSYYYRVVAVY